MIEVELARLDFTQEEVSQLSQLRRGPQGYTFAQELGIWEQWVKELMQRQLWTKVELESACDSRDNVEESLMILPDAFAGRIFVFLDELDSTYRDLTVADGPQDHKAGRWWWGRIPIRNSQRRYLIVDYKED